MTMGETDSKKKIQSRIFQGGYLQYKMDEALLLLQRQ